MLPSRRQYRKWSLPTKWSFWGAVIGVPIGILSILVTMWPLATPDSTIAERNELRLQTAQEMRYNHGWLSELAKSLRNSSESMPVGSIKVDGLLQLVEHHHDWLLGDAYGEEKYVYQLSLRLRDLAIRLGTPHSRQALVTTPSSLHYTVDDLHFLNNFLFWYLRPHISENLTQAQLYLLGWHGFLGDTYTAPFGDTPKMKKFVHDGQPIVGYLMYLGLID